MTVAAIALFFSLGLDTFAVAVGLGAKRVPRSEWPKIGLTFAAFEGLMPVVGLLLGHRATTLIGGSAGYVAGTLLVLLGVWEIREAVFDRNDDDEAHALASVAHARALWVAGLSVSLDELAIGFSLGMLHVSVLLALTFIAAQAFVITFVGLRVGAHAGARLGERAELAAGILLAVLGAVMIASERFGAGIG